MPWWHVLNRTGPGGDGVGPAGLETGGTAGLETCGTSPRRLSGNPPGWPNRCKTTTCAGSFLRGNNPVSGKREMVRLANIQEPFASCSH
jgi:hypothetical protein